MTKKRSQDLAEDGYGPSEDEDDDYYGKLSTKRGPFLGNFKKRKRKRGKVNFLKKDCNFEENLQDPLAVFGWDIMLMILSHLDARSVALSLLVSRGWHGVASSDTLWFKKTQPQQPYIKIFLVLICYLLMVLWMIHQKTIKKWNSRS